VSGVIQTSSQVGGSLGLAVLATLATSRTNQLLARGQSRAMALTDGYHLAFIVAAGVLVVAVVLTVSIFRREWAGPLD
jgi:NADH:ubiquinone oxidoreductase subunit 6 (subunit J)